MRRPRAGGGPGGGVSLAGDAAHVHPIAYEAERLPVAAGLLADTARRYERVLAAVREPGRGTEAGMHRED